MQKNNPGFKKLAQWFAISMLREPKRDGKVFLKALCIRKPGPHMTCAQHSSTSNGLATCKLGAEMMKVVPHLRRSHHSSRTLQLQLCDGSVRQHNS